MKIINIKLPILLLTLMSMPLAMMADTAEDTSRKIPSYDVSFVGKAAQRKAPRDYRASPTATDKKDLRYILGTLAKSSLLKISWNTASLKKAGDRIDHLHPFKFFEAVFADDELRGYIRHFQGRNWVWKEFVDGTSESLARENAANNLKPHLQEFADQMGIDVQILRPFVLKQKWKDLINALIVNSPR